MTIELHSIGSVRFLIEPSSSFAVDRSNDLTLYQYLPAREGSITMTLEQPGIDPMSMVASRAEYRKEVFGPRKATLAMTLNLAPTGIAASASIAAVSSSLGNILKTIFGGEFRGTGSSFTGGTAVAPTVTSAAGFASGSVVGRLNSSGDLEVREIKSISGNTLTLDYAFSAAPTNGDVAYAGATYFITEDPQESLQFLVEGLESQDRWVLLGGQCTSYAQAIDVAGASLPSITLTFTFADWKDSAECSGTITGVLSDPSYNNYQPIVGYEGQCRVTTIGTTTYNVNDIVHISAIEITPKVVFNPVTSPSGKNTIYRWRGGRLSPPVEGTFTTFFEDLEWFNARKNSSDLALFYQMGMDPGYAIAMSVPTIQILNPQRVAQGEIAGQNPTFKGRRNINNTGTNEIAKSPFKIHLL